MFVREQRPTIPILFPVFTRHRTKKEITLQRDEFFLLSYNEKVIPIDIEREKLEYCRTLVYWLNWTNRTKKYSLYNDVIERSLLVLKLMSYYNGAVLAALTTSLPETVGDVRNWDYRFVG